MEKVPGHGLCPDLSGPGRPSRSMHIPVLDSSDAELPYLAISYLKIAHWSILLRGNDGHVSPLNTNGHFYLPKMRFAFWAAMNLAALSLFGNPSFGPVSNSTCVKTRVSARPSCDFLYTKNSARQGSGFYLHKE